MDRFWDALRDRLGLHALRRQVEHIHKHLQGTETTMAKLSEELADISRRVEAMRDAQTTSSTNVRDALARLEEKVGELSDGELSADNQA